jgi:flagellar assembly factor FliW
MQTKLMSFRLEHKHENGIVGNNNNMTSKQMNLHKNSYPYKGSSDKSEQQIYKKYSQ